MSLWIIHYTYDTRDSLRAETLDEHLWYLAGLADAGAMIAYGKYDDEAEPGALLIASAPTKHHARDLVAEDPFVIVGAVADISIRPWDGHLGPWWKNRKSPPIERSKRGDLDARSRARRAP
ncbi:YciI family protein [Demequina sp.]|uniref:YciI family protein n=1 Tax=Demequina sp. TaxID=2050685 RepID=UPI0025C327DB|nr:YciI family protein [Demequina sp.]